MSTAARSTRSTVRMADRLRPAAALVAVAGLLGLAACSAEEQPDGGPTVVASFYPLVFVSERVGGPEVQVHSLTPAGSDPHSLELSPAHVVPLSAAGLVVYSPRRPAASGHPAAPPP